MNILIGSVLLWLVAIYLLRRLRARDADRLPEAFERAKQTILFLLPRVAVGLLGAGFLGAILPHDEVARWFGQDAGWWAILLATAVGSVTPGGPFVAFAIGAGALKAGATEAALIAYVSAWSVVAVNRSLVYELPILGGSFLARRIALSLPVPLVLGAIAQMLG